MEIFLFTKGKPISDAIYIKAEQRRIYERKENIEPRNGGVFRYFLESFPELFTHIYTEAHTHIHTYTIQLSFFS